MRIIAIDPGPEESAYVIFEDGKLLDWAKVDNSLMAGVCRSGAMRGIANIERCVIEKIASYGMTVGAEVFETCVWSGRFMEAFGADQCDRIPRLAVKMHLCHSPRANDATVRQAIIDRYGPGKDKAIGKKATPGPLFGVAGDIWSALAVAITWTETRP